MKQKLQFLICFLFTLSISTKAQIFQQGLISASPNISGFHDSANCVSFANEMYGITKTNSFVGDSIKFVDPFSGFLINYAVNTTGQNPWSTFLTSNSMNPIVPDDQLSSGFAVFGGQPFKIISGIDTIYNVMSFFQLPVPNPCTYGTVTGKVYIDNNSDCIYNIGDDALSSISIQCDETLSNSTNILTKYGYSNGTGNYSVNLQQSWMTNYTVQLPSNYQFIFPITSCNPISYSYATLPQNNVDFSLQCTSNIDAQVYASHPINARPGIPFILNPLVNNTGCDSATGVLTLIKDPNTIYNASLSSNPASTVIGDTLSWNYTNLTNISNGGYWNSFFAGVHLTPNTTVNIGDTLCFQVKATIQTNDLNPSNNQYSFCIPVVNSYDPNIKEVSPKGIGTPGNIPQSQTDLQYTIHFQNTGTASAFNVSIIDTFDADIQPASFKIIGNSHAMTPQWLAPNIVKLNFYNINLPDSNSNEAKSHGSVQFNVKLKSGLAIGTEIKNKAQIYFDSNPAIVTNTTLNTIYKPNSIQSFDEQHSFSIYPNPANDYVMIEFKNKPSSNLKIEIMNLNGQIIKSELIVTSNTKMNIESLHAGIYFLKISDGKQSYQYKLIKD